jgi:phosphomannomutase/phosphoglucomutase
MSLNKFFSSLTLVLALLIGLAMGGFLVFLSQQSQVESQLRLKMTAQSLAAGLTTIVKQTEQVMDSLAKEEGLAELLSSDNSILLAEKEKSFLAILPNAKMVSLLPKGFSDANFTAKDGIGFADLELVRRAESGGKPTVPGVFGKGAKNNHVGMVRAVVSKGDVVGVLHASYSVAAIKELFSKSAQEDELMMLKQGALVIAAAGNSNLAKGGSAETMPVASTNWVISYHQSDRTLIAKAFNEWMVVLIISGAAILLLVLVVFLMGRQLAEWIRLDQVTTIRLVESLLEGSFVRGSYPVKLANFQGTIDSILAFQRKEVGSPAFKVEVQQERTKEEEDSLVPPSLLYMNEGIELDSVGADDAKVPKSIFRAYDIRGIVEKTLTKELVYDIGRALGSEAYEAGQQSVIIARDGRLSSPELSESLAKGLQDSGRDVIDLGMVPTPVLYFATHYLGSNSGVMITGSHNPPDYNGLKMVIDGETLSGERINELRERIVNGDLLSGNGGYESRNIVADYISTISGDVHIGQPMKIVIDCGNGVAGEIAPTLFKTMGCEVIELYCEVDGNFPNHHPDPSKPENLEELIKVVREEQADLGLAFDGDGDRLGFVDSAGNVIWPDRQMMLFSADVLSRQPGADIIFDVKCTRNLASEIVKHGGRPIMWKTGHSLIKAKIKETGAMLAGEMSGHIFFKERWYGFDDGLYAGARMIEIISADSQSSEEIFAALPDSVNTPELNVLLEEGENFKFIDALLAVAKFPDATVNTIDGLRVDFSEGWGLVRASNTTPTLVIRFEANSRAALLGIQDQFSELMKKVKPDIELPF